MVFKIVWSSNALKSYIGNIKYLEKDWTHAEVEKFISAVQRVISILSLQPKTGRLTGEKFMSGKLSFTKEWF